MKCWSVQVSLTYVKPILQHCAAAKKQRVAIASALAMQSKILILDEPTSGQDGKETKELLALLRQLNQEGITILLITHDMEIMASECSPCTYHG